MLTYISPNGVTPYGSPLAKDAESYLLNRTISVLLLTIFLSSRHNVVHQKTLFMQNNTKISYDNFSISHRLSMVELRPSSSLSTGCVVSLRGD